jgi:hypothetical protein
MGAYNLSANGASFLGGGNRLDSSSLALEAFWASGLNATAQFVVSYGWSMSLSAALNFFLFRSLLTLCRRVSLRPGMG